MADFNPGLPQQEAQGGVGALSPNIDAVTQPGRAMEHVGQAIEQTTDYLHRRNAQEEVSNVYSDIADSRARWTDEVNQGLASGNFDIDKFKEGYQQDVGTIGDNLQTPEGKNFFNRQQARLQGTLMQRAAHVQAAIKGKEAVEDFQDGVTQDSNTAESNPEQFPDLIDGSEEALQAKMGTGAVAAVDAPKMRKFAQSKIAEGAARGWAKMDPGVGPDGKPNQNLLLQLMASKDADGNSTNPFNDYLDSGKQEELTKLAHTQDEGRFAEKERPIRLQKQNFEDQASKWELQNLPALSNNSLSAKQVLDARDVLGPAKTLEYLRLIKQNAKQPTETNDRTYVRLATGIQAQEDDPSHVPSTSPIWQEVKNGNLSVAHANQLTQEFNRTKYAQDMNVEKGNAYKAAGEAIRFKAMTPDGSTQYADVGESNYAAFLQNAHRLESASEKSGGNMKSLYDPLNKDGVYQLANKYRIQPQDQDRMQAEFIKKAMIKKSPVEKMLPGESIMDYNKRVPQVK